MPDQQPLSEPQARAHARAWLNQQHTDAHELLVTLLHYVPEPDRTRALSPAHHRRAAPPGPAAGRRHRPAPGRPCHRRRPPAPPARTAAVERFVTPRRPQPSTVTVVSSPAATNGS